MSKFKLVIVGGGTAGWIAANYLNTQLPKSFEKQLEVTLIEASDIPTVGVGEATIPSLRTTLQACGINELEFLQQCDATFKHGIEFVQWRHNPQKDIDDSYFHPFGTPVFVPQQDSVKNWSRVPSEQRPDFGDAFSVQYELAKQGRAPKSPRDKAYDGALSYAYHLDAGKLAEFLKRHARSRGVQHLIAKVSDVKLDGKQNISALTLDTGDTVEADLFVDCTGFAARLINSDKTNTFISKSDQLFVDRAVTTRIPHRGIPDINGYTKCTAQESGWIWDIALQGRRGVGHVYSSRYINDEDARLTLAKYVGVAPDELQSRKLDMRIGYHQHQWRGNCVAIGLASGFLEPLESTGIFLAEMASWLLKDFIPRYSAGLPVQTRYNELMSHHYENIVDFLKMHYCLSGRTDSQFWLDNKKPESIPNTLKKNLELWRDNIPLDIDFTGGPQCFAVPNYQFVLYGMGWQGHTEPASEKEIKAITKDLHELSIRRERLKQFVLRDTVDNAELFKHIIADS